MVTVDTAEEQEIEINTTIILTGEVNIDTVKSSITSEINKYLLELRREWEKENSLIVRISQIENRILNINSVLDISNTTMNGQTSNLELSANKIPVLGVVEVLT